MLLKAQLQYMSYRGLFGFVVDLAQQKCARQGGACARMDRHHQQAIRYNFGIGIRRLGAEIGQSKTTHEG